MELSAKILREVEFRYSLRGYDAGEVDEFLEKVAVGVEETQEMMRQLVARAERAERATSDRAVEEDGDAIRRTLVLAQRTADMAVREAQEEAAQILDGARSEAEHVLADSRENALRFTTEAERRHGDEIARLEAQMSQVRDALAQLSQSYEAERQRLGDSLRATLSFVDKTLPTVAEIQSRSVPVVETTHGPEPVDIEAEISEDAQAAAPSVFPDDVQGSDEEEFGEPRGDLAAFRPLDESGPPTEAWQAEPMSMFPGGGDRSHVSKPVVYSQRHPEPGAHWDA